MATEVEMDTIPNCNFTECNSEPHGAKFDFRMAAGPWAYGCDKAWKMHRATPALGTGHGQRMYLRPEPRG